MEEGTHILEMRRRQGKVSETSMVNGGKHTLPRDKKAEESERDERGQWRKAHTN
jgi:hypothetical protein